MGYPVGFLSVVLTISVSVLYRSAVFSKESRGVLKGSSYLTELR